MLNWINLEEEEIVNPLARIPKIGGKEREEDRVVTDEELRLLWPLFVDSDALAPATGIALRLIFLTAQRPIQIAGMRLDGKRDFPRTLTPTLLMDCSGIGRYWAVQAVAALGKLKGSRSVISASPVRRGNSVRTWRSHANGSTREARQVSIRL